jgi:hypothetical protein
MAPRIDRAARTTRRATRVAIAAAAAGACACSLVTSIPDLTSGSTGDASTQEASADGLAPQTDGALDADAGNHAETSLDASQDGPGDGGGGFPDGSWCAQQPTAGLILCDDFDYETLTFARWSRAQFDVTGSADFSPLHVSAPHSFEINVPQHTSSTYFVETLQKDVGGAASAASLSLDFQFQPVVISDAAGSNDVLVCAMAQGPGAPRVAISVHVGWGFMWMQEQITDATGKDTFNSSSFSQSSPPAGSFSDLALTIAFGTPPTATLRYEGTTVVTLPLQGGWQPQATTVVYLGDWYTVSTPGYDMLFDDAVIRQQ